MIKAKCNVAIVTRINGVETNRTTRFTTVYMRNDGTSFIRLAFDDREVKLNKRGAYEFVREIKSARLIHNGSVRRGE